MSGIEAKNCGHAAPCRVRPLGSGSTVSTGAQVVQHQAGPALLVAQLSAVNTALTAAPDSKELRQAQVLVTTHCLMVAYAACSLTCHRRLACDAVNNPTRIARLAVSAHSQTSNALHGAQPAQLSPARRSCTACAVPCCSNAWRPRATAARHGCGSASERTSCMRSPPCRPTTAKCGFVRGTATT